MSNNLPSFLDGTFRFHHGEQRSVWLPPAAPAQKFQLGQRVKAEGFFGTICGFAYEAPTLYRQDTGWSYSIQIEGSIDEREPVERLVRQEKLTLIETNSLLPSPSAPQRSLPLEWSIPKFWFNSKVRWNDGLIVFEGKIHGMEFKQGRWRYGLFIERVTQQNGNPYHVGVFNESMQVAPEEELMAID